MLELAYLLGFAALGAGVVRAFKLQARSAMVAASPCLGLAVLAIAGTWATALHVPMATLGAVFVVLAAAGAVWNAPSFARRVREAMLGRASQAILDSVLLGLAVLLPGVLIRLALGGVDVPISPHDGAFHVETVDALRRGDFEPTWYPIGFHSTAASLLALAPWVDTARGASLTSVALVQCAPIAAFALAQALGLSRRVSAGAALSTALTFVFPYDNLLWAGFPLSMSLVLLVGLWVVVVEWFARPQASLALLAGVCGVAILLTHGTELYSAAVGLVVIAAWRAHRACLPHLTRDIPIAAAAAVMLALPYAPRLLGWVAAGGAAATGAEVLDGAGFGPARPGNPDWLEFALAATGSASLLDLPARAALLSLGVLQVRRGLPTGLWLGFALILFVVSFVDVPPVRWLYTTTYPWLLHLRPPQVVVLFASLLIARGAWGAFDWLGRRAEWSAARRRRVLVGAALVVAFFAEGSAVSVYKTLAQVAQDQGVYSADDGVAMAWLRQHAAPGEMLVNNRSLDAGIWAPYKAHVPILLPRSAGGASLEDRERIARNVLDLESAPDVRREACQLRAAYVYKGAREAPWDPPIVPDRAALERAPRLEEVFRSGQAMIFRLHLAC